MSAKGRQQFLEAVAENETVIQYVKLFRMPLFLTVLDDEFKKCDDSVWNEENSVRETALKVMPFTLHQFSVPQEETEKVIGECMAEYLKKQKEG